MNEYVQKSRTVSDDEIVEMYWQREEKAIRETDKKYGKLLFRIAYNILSSDNDAEECRNDTYLSVWNLIPPTRPTVFKAFISKIMRNIAIARYKSRSAKKRVPTELTVPIDELDLYLRVGNSPEEEYEEEEVGKLISDYVRGLGEREQFAFVGRFYFCEPVKNIAREMGITPSAVYQMLDKLKQDLKIYLERNGVYI